VDEAGAVVGGGAQGGQGGAVLGGAVTHVVVPAVTGIAVTQGVHQPVPCDLRNYRSGGDAVAPGVAVHDRLVGPAKGRERAAVDEDGVGDHSKPGQGTTGGSDCRLQNVVPFDLADRGRTERDVEGAEANERREAFALEFAEHLRVRDAGDSALVGRHHDGAHDNGARERAPSDFVHTGDETASAAQFALKWVEASARRHRAPYSPGAGTATRRSRMRDCLAPTALRR